MSESFRGKTTRIRGVVLVLVVSVLGVMLLLSGVVAAQAPVRGGGPAQEAPEQAATSRIHGSLLHVMRAIVFINANVIFAAQSEDPAAMTPDEFGATSTDPLTGLYGKWQAVENASIALAEAANLLTIPGRRCANGRTVPIQDADWPKFVEELRDAGMAAFKAAQSKNQDSMIEVSDTIVTACANCHEKYRDWENMTEEMANRCRASRAGARP